MNKRAAETSASGDEERFVKRVYKKCSTNNCTNFAQIRGVCIKHGAKVKKYYCKVEGCTNQAKLGGVCIKHGAKVKKCYCKHEGCTNQVYVEGLCWTHLTLKRKHDDASVISDDNDSDSDDDPIDGGNARRVRQRLESHNQNVHTPQINNSGRCEDDSPIEEENNNNAAVNNMDSAAGASDFGGDDNGGTFDDDETPNPLSPAVPNTNTNLREEPTPNNNEGNHDAIYAGDLDNEDPPHTTHMEHSDSAVEDEIETQGVER